MQNISWFITYIATDILKYFFIVTVLNRNHKNIKIIRQSFY